MPSRNQYLKVIINDYLKSNKKGKGRILDEYCRNTGQNRKYVIRKIWEVAFEGQKPRKRRKVKNGYDVRDALSKIWEVFDYPCGHLPVPSTADREVKTYPYHRD